jgi:predicted glycogen debranching enzyme
MLEFGHDTLSDPGASLSIEWLETNGLGGFASSTIIGLNTRRYHGLLTAATRPPVGRVLTLAKLEETLVIGGRRYELSDNQYPGVIHPQGYQYQSRFRLDPFPTFTWKLPSEGAADGDKEDTAELMLEKSIFMIQGQNATVICYQLIDQDPVDRPILLELRPLVAFRDYHATTHENGALNQQVDTEDGLTTIQPYPDLPALHFAHDVCEIDTRGEWYRNFEYAAERERGLDFAEDLFHPFTLVFDLNRLAHARVIAATEQFDIRGADHYREVETARRRALSLPSNSKFASEIVTELNATLGRASDQFLVARGDNRTVVAGYHWFSDWGRDTMIALPGLTLTTGQPETARSILREFSRYVDRGMLPNRFPDAGETPEYNTVDATLWYFEAVHALLEQTRDYDFVRREIYDTLVGIVAWHVRGTRYNIQVDGDGLLASGAPGVQLTWMDAKAGDHVVTPRHGKPVEIQSLWYNALRVMEALAREFGHKADQKQYAAMAKLARDSFNLLFWNDADLCLYDCIDGESRDASIRPNQIFAISLPHSMIGKDRAEQVLRVVERELLTPRGLRTLAPGDPQYRGRYEGNQRERDSAYHQGTVWPWLMGPYLTAYSRIFGVAAGREFAAAWLEGFQPHLKEACLGQVAEIFDGDPPHAPRGCVAQAWSVAELLRAIEAVFRAHVSQRAAKAK